MNKPKKTAYPVTAAELNACKWRMARCQMHATAEGAVILLHAYIHLLDECLELVSLTIPWL